MLRFIRSDRSWWGRLVHPSVLQRGLATGSPKSVKASRSSPKNSLDKAPTIQPNELPIKPRVVVKNSTSFASAIVRLVDDSDIDAYRKMMQTLRENPQIKSALLETLSSQSTDSPLSTKPWFNQWVIKALDDPTSPLFPLSLLSEDANEILERKATLASLLFACRYTADTPFRNYLLSNSKIAAEPSKLEETHYRKATKLANEIGDTFSLAKLDRLIVIMRDFLAGQQSEEELLHMILSACHLHIDKLENLFRYLEIPMSSTVRDLCSNRQLERAKVVDRLAAELLYLVYTRGGNSVNGQGDLVKGDGGAALAEGIRRDLGYISLGIFHVLELRISCYPRQRVQEAGPAGLGVGTDRRLVYGREAGVSEEAGDTEEFPSPRVTSFTETHAVWGEGIKESLAVSAAAPASPPTSLLMGHASPYLKVLIDNLPPGAGETEVSDSLRKIGGVRKVWVYGEAEVDAADNETTGTGSRKTKEAQGSKIEAELGHGAMGAVAESNLEIIREVMDDRDDSDGDGDVDADADPADENKHYAIASKIYSEMQANKQLAKDASRTARKLPTIPKKTATSKFLTKKFDLKRKLAKGTSTDRYAFVLFEDEEAFSNAMRDDVRLFGVNVQGNACRTHKSANFTQLLVEMHSPLLLPEALQLLK
eukprot:gene25106-30323_t